MMGLPSPRVVALALCCVQCGGAAARPETWPATVRMAATRTDLEALLARLAKEQLCKQLVDRFVPISITPPQPGPAAGLAASTGAWWVRSCNPVQLGDFLVAFELYGPGW